MARYNIFFFNDTATTEIYTLSLHDALPISDQDRQRSGQHELPLQNVRRDLLLTKWPRDVLPGPFLQDRKSTRLNSSHDQISYAVFCLKKKKNRNKEHRFRT